MKVEGKTTLQSFLSIYVETHLACNIHTYVQREKYLLVLSEPHHFMVCLHDFICLTGGIMLSVQ